MGLHRIIACGLVMLLPTAAVQAQEVPTQAAQTGVLALESMDARQIDSLDRAKTVFILPIGMIEEHGPHLPVGADTIWVAHSARALAQRLHQSLPEWAIVTMPNIEYGFGGANGFSGNLIDPGTYGIRQSTLRALVADLGDQIAQNHFKWILVLSHHGAPPHQEAINQACDFVTETDHVTMVNLTGLANEDPEANKWFEEKIQPKYYSDADLKSFGVEMHAGKDETSIILAEQPTAVRSVYRTLPQPSGSDIPALVSLARKPGWPGYFGAPAAANAAYGEELLELLDSTAAKLAQRILKGEDLSQRPRSPGSMMADPKTRATVEDESDDAKAFGAKLQEWLGNRKTQRK